MYVVKHPTLPWYWSNAEFGFVDKPDATKYTSKLVASLAAGKTPGAIVVAE